MVIWFKLFHNVLSEGAISITSPFVLVTPIKRLTSLPSVSSISNGIYSNFESCIWIAMLLSLSSDIV